MDAVSVQPFPARDVEDVEEEGKGPVGNYGGAELQVEVGNTLDEGRSLGVVEGERTAAKSVAGRRVHSTTVVPAKLNNRPTETEQNHTAT